MHASSLGLDGTSSRTSSLTLRTPSHVLPWHFEAPQSSCSSHIFPNYLLHYLSSSLEHEFSEGKAHAIFTVELSEPSMAPVTWHMPNIFGKKEGKNKGGKKGE